MMATDGSPQAFAIVGDSNVRPHINKNSCRGNVQLKNAQVLSCGYLGIFAETLSKIKGDSTVCIISCLTNFLSKSNPDGPSTVSHRVDPVLQEIRDILVDACSRHPGRWYMVSPLMYRTNPTWFRDGLPEVLTLFSQVFSIERPDNLRLLPSFPTPSYEEDGVHLTAYSGLEFVLHLFDVSQEMLQNLDSAQEEVSCRSAESTRALEDRVMVLEQDHRRLNRVVEGKTAVDAELADFHINERWEDCFVIYGLAQIPKEIVGKPWQERAVRDVKEVLLILLGRDAKIVFVSNATSRGKDAEIVYNVKMSELADARLIRTKFGSFFLGSQDKRPDNLKHINIKNRVTPETRTRISILKLLASRYRASNPGGRAQVISHEPRPIIKITPPEDASDRRIRSYTYVEAVKVLPCNFSSEEVAPIVRRLNPKLVGQVKALFVVLSDDQLREQIRRFDKKKESAGNSGPVAQVQDEAADATSGSSSTGSGNQPFTNAGGSRSRSNKRGGGPLIGAPPKK